MPFPLTVGNHTWQSGPELVSAVVADARAGGGTVVRSQAPSTWVANLVDEGTLEAELATGLVAALLQRHQEPLPVAEAARLAKKLGRPELGELLLLSLDALDVGLLLTTDDDRRAASVEDVVLEAAASLVDLSDPIRRERLLARLRNAGRSSLEARVLALHGTAEEIATMLPAVLLEGLPPGAVDAVVQALGRGGEVTEALLDVLRDGLPADDRATLLAALEASGESAALDTARKRLPSD